MSVAPLRSVSRRPLNLDRHGFHADRAALGRDRHRDRRGDRTPGHQPRSGRRVRELDDRDAASDQRCEGVLWGKLRQRLLRPIVAMAEPAAVRERRGVHRPGVQSEPHRPKQLPPALPAGSARHSGPRRLQRAAAWPSRLHLLRRRLPAAPSRGESVLCDEPEWHHLSERAAYPGDTEWTAAPAGAPDRVTLVDVRPTLVVERRLRVRRVPLRACRSSPGRFRG